jgi:hypothetical protein
MKQKVIIIICIIVLIVGGVSEIKYLQKSSTYLSSDMDYIKNAIDNDNYALAKEQVEKSYEMWDKSKNMWNIFIIHDEIDNIEEAIIELKEYISFENKEECIVAIEKIKKYLDHTVNRQELKIDNVL